MGVITDHYEASFLEYSWVRLCGKKRVVKRLRKKSSFDMILIQETKMMEENSRSSRWIRGNKAISMELVKSDGNSGGLITAWRENLFAVEKKIISQRYILLIGTIEEDNFKCGLGSSLGLDDEVKVAVHVEESTSGVRLEKLSLGVIGLLALEGN
ncbi:hypothetical protein PTKIN_Ptkin06aG0082600 [Pterospermum kingtungense]